MTARRGIASVLSAALVAGFLAPAHAKSVDELVGVAALARVNLQRISVQQAAAALAAESQDLDNDNYPESPAMRAGGGPVGGGLIPLASAAPKDDSYGTRLGYCAFDNGGSTGLAGHIAGGASSSSPVMAVITAGADNVFQTTCAGIFSAVTAGSGTGVQGDDFALTYSSTQIRLGLGGSPYFGDPVADEAALTQLASNPAALSHGEVRLTKNDNTLHAWNGSAWVKMSSGPFSSSVAGNPGSYFSTAPIVIGSDVPSSNRLLVTDAGVPLGLQSSGVTNGIQFFDQSSVQNGFAGVDNGSGNLVLLSRSGAAVKLGQLGAVDYVGTFDSTGLSVKGNIVASQTVIAKGVDPSSSVYVNPAFELADAPGTGLYRRMDGGNGFGISGGNLPVLEFSDDNIKLGMFALHNYPGLQAGGNVALGQEALYLNSASGAMNAALGYRAGRAVTTGSNNVFLGANSNTSLDSGSYMTAVGAGVNVSTSNTVVLGRTDAVTVIGAEGASGSAANLQITGSSQHMPQAVAPTGSAGMLYYNSALNRFQYHNGVVWADMTYGGALPISSLAAAIADNQIDNGDFAQTWRWSLTSPGKTGISVVESSASTGGTGNQVLMSVGTLAGSSAIPFAVRSRGVEVFRVDSVNPQVVLHNGTMGVPSLSFAGQQGTGFYLPSAGSLAASLQGVRSVYINSDSVNNKIGIGFEALLNDTGTENLAIGFAALKNNSGASNTGVGFGVLTDNQGSWNSAFGTGALARNTTGNGNTAFGAYTLSNNTSGMDNVALGPYVLEQNITGFENVAIGLSSMSANTSGSYNVAVGSSTLQGASGDSNTAVGATALSWLNTGSRNVAIGERAGDQLQNGSDNVFIGSGSLTSADRGKVTLIGSGTRAITAPANPDAYMTAIGSGSAVSTINTVVLGRTTDKTVIGATGANSSAALLQINGASQHVGQASAPTGSAGMMYYDSTTNRMMVHNGTAWVNLSSPALSQITAATAANTIANGVNAQTWNWALTGNATGMAFGETIASTGGTGTQYVMTVGTLAGSTASALAVRVRGVEAFRVDNVNPQVLHHAGTAAAPAIAFSADKTSGLYQPASGQLAMSVGGVRSFFIAPVNTGVYSIAIGPDALATNTNTTTPNIAIGRRALFNNTTGNNIAIGNNVLEGNRGSSNTAVGHDALKANTTGNFNAAFGLSAAAKMTTGFNNLAIGNLSLNNETIGYGNTALGTGSLQLSYATNGNTAVGYEALRLNYGGAMNVAVGYLAGNQFSDGSNNTFVGAHAGMWGDSYSQVTLLGANSSVGAVAGSSYMTALGAEAIVESANTVVLGRPTDSVVIGSSVAGPYQFFVNGTAGGTSAYAVSSDRRFKRDIVAIRSPLDIIRKLQGVTYEFDHKAFPDRKFEKGRQIGFIAQQIEEFLPEVVRTDAQGYKSVQYSQVVPLLVEGIKAQQDVLQHFRKQANDTMALDIKTFQAQDVIVENFKAGNVRTAMLEAESARIKNLKAETIESKSVRSDVVKSGDAAVFVEEGMFQPIFSPSDNAQYLVNAVADDGSIAFASVAVVKGEVIVKPVNNSEVDIIARQGMIGLVAANKRVKATWIRLG